MQTCISDVKTRMTENKVKLSDKKTDTRFLMKSNRTIAPDAQPTSLHVGTANIHFMTCTCNLGFMISDNMTPDKHILNVCHSAYTEVR